jgi:hypothetical protein
MEPTHTFSVLERECDKLTEKADKAARIREAILESELFKFTEDALSWLE